MELQADLLTEEGLTVEVPRSGRPSPVLLEVLRVLTLGPFEVAQLILALEPTGSRRRYRPVQRLRKSFGVSAQQARLVGDILAELAMDAIGSLPPGKSIKNKLKGKNSATDAKADKSPIEVRLSLH
eukprot:scaffold142866_cov37-Prasinocladus_malaysianus.AAC.1